MSETPDRFYVTLSSNSINTFTVHLPHEIVLPGKDGWEVALFESSCTPSNVGTITPHMIVGATMAMMLFNLISQQFVGDKKDRFLRTFIHPTDFCNQVFENLY